jgi:pentatricopeptide repeat protein
MDFLMLITAYGKLASFDKAERLMKYMNDNGFAPSVISHTALMESYGRAKQYNKAEAIFRRMQSAGPSPSPLTYQIILKTFVEVCCFDSPIGKLISSHKEVRLSLAQKEVSLLFFVQIIRNNFYSGGEVHGS